MPDIAELGLVVNSDGFVVANKRLRETEKQAGRTEKAAQRMTRQADRMGKAMKRMGRTLSLSVTAPLVAAAAASAKLAIDAEETANKFNVVFRGSIESSRTELQRLTQTIPLTRTQMEGLAAGVQDMLVPMGVARDQAAGMSVDMVRLAGDLASFNNVGTDRVLNAMQSALAGSSEPMRRFGVDTRVTRLEQIALRDGLIDTGDEMDNAAMATATLTAIMEDSSDAIGDAERTVDSAANQLRFLARDARQLAEDLGKDLIPIIRDMVPTLRNAVNWFSELTPETQKMVIQAAALAAAIGPLLIIIGRLIRSLVALRVAFVALSGPVGIVATAIAGITAAYLNNRREIEKLRQPTDEAAAAINRMREATEGDMSTASVENFGAALRDLNREIIEAEKSLQRMLEVQAMTSGGGPGGPNVSGIQIKAQRERLQVMQEEREVAEARLDIMRQFPTEAERVAVAQEYMNSLTSKAVGFLADYRIVSREAADAAQQNAEATQAAAEASKEFTGPLEERVGQLKAELEQLQGNANALLEYEMAQSLAKAAALDAKEGTDANTEAARRLWEQIIALNEAIREQERTNRSGGETGGLFGSLKESFEALPDILDAALDGLSDIEAEMQRIAQIEFGFENLIDSFNPLSQAMRQLGDDIDLVNARIETGNMSEMEGMFVKTGVAANAAFGAIMSGMDRSSQEYEQMQVAQQALNVALGIAAILQQGMGDPYTAIPRMIAMAAMVASLVDGIGGLSGGGANRAEDRQAIQGTGSVLGDPEAQSESITNAVEITADATSELVGINRGMLRALQNLQAGISGASGMLARGASQFEVDMTGMGSSDFVEAIQIAFDPLAALFGISVGGKADIVDSGIQILGGTIDELINDTLIRAYQEVAEKKHFLDDTDYKVYTDALDQELLSQFQLIFESISDTVVEAAKALGLDEDAIADAVAGFQVGEMMISLEGLDADEQQAELEAVFGEIFDGLVRSVIPFIGQFQNVGEGLGETLVRVATSVQVMQEAVTQLGLSVDQSDPETFAQISVGLIEMSGGVEEFINQMSSFVNKFATDSHQFAIAQDQLNRAFEQVGLAVPETSEGMFELMRSLDASTEEGRRQIATLLELSETAAQYYDLLEDREEERLETIGRLRGQEAQLMAVIEQRAMAAQDALDAAGFGGLDATAFDVDSLNAFLSEIGSMPPGMQEAVNAILDLIDAESELEAMREQEAREIRDFVGGIAQELNQLAGLDHRNEFAAINQQFAELTQRAHELGLGEQTLSRIRQIHTLKLRQLAAQLEESIMSITDQLFGMGQDISSSVSNVSSASQDFSDAMSVTADAIADTILQIQGTQGLSTLSPVGQRDFLQQQFDAAIASGDFAQANQIAPQLAQAIRDVGSSSASADAMIRDLLDDLAGIPTQETSPPTHSQVGSIQSSASAIERNTAEQMSLAVTLLDQIGLLSEITGESAFEIADRLEVPMAELVGVLLDVESITTEQIGQLGAISETLGVGLHDLANTIGVEIGQLAQSESMLNDALEAAIGGLPPEIAGPLLDALTAVEQGGNVSELESLVSELDTQFRDQLAPFFDAIDMSDPMLTQISIQEGIEMRATEIRDALMGGQGVLGDILSALSASNSANDIPGYATGTPFVPNDGPAFIHRGERILSSTDNRELIEAIRSRGDNVSTRLVEERLERIELAIRDTGKEQTDATRKGTGDISSQLKRIPLNF